LSKSRASQVCGGQVGTSQVGVIKAGPAQVGGEQRGTAQIGVDQGRIKQVSTTSMTGMAFLLSVWPIFGCRGPLAP
jgi:hypothetical protein